MKTVVKYKKEGELVSCLVHLENKNGDHVSEVGYKEFDSLADMKDFYGKDEVIYSEQL